MRWGLQCPGDGRSPGGVTSYGDGTTEIFVTGDCQEDEEGAELEPACLVVHVESALGNIPTCSDGSCFHCFHIKGLLGA